MKLANKVAEVIVEEEPPELVQEDEEMQPVYIINENLEDIETAAATSEIKSISPDTSQVHIVDHQYVSLDLYQSTQLEDYSRKEMDVFDYIGIEIKNIQEQEERAKQLQLQNEATTDQPASVEVGEYLIEEVVDESFADQDDEPGIITIERIDEIKVGKNDEKAGDELSAVVDIVNDSSFQCKLCPKMYQKKNITVMHLKTAHQIVLGNYNYGDHNRYRKPQKDLNFKCRFCPKLYTSRKFVDRHELLHGPSGDLIHKCCCCQLYFETEEKKDAHQFAQHNDKLVCKVENCDKRFDNPEKLVGHVRYAHSKTVTVRKYNFVCQLCGKS